MMTVKGGRVAAAAAAVALFVLEKYILKSYRIQKYIYINTCICVCVYIYIYIYINICLCLYVFLYDQLTDSKTGRVVI